MPDVTPTPVPTRPTPPQLAPIPYPTLPSQVATPDEMKMAIRIALYTKAGEVSGPNPNAEQIGNQTYMAIAGINPMLDELERNLIEIVHSPSRISAADLEQIRRRIDAASLLFKVRVMSDELRQREGARDRSTPRVSTSTRITS